MYEIGFRSCSVEYEGISGAKKTIKAHVAVEFVVVQDKNRKSHTCVSVELKLRRKMLSELRNFSNSNAHMLHISLHYVCISVLCAYIL